MRPGVPVLLASGLHFRRPDGPCRALTAASAWSHRQFPLRFGVDAAQGLQAVP